MTSGLPVSRLISVALNLSPTAAPTANYNSLLIIGNTDVINVADRIRSYNTLSAVAADFGTAVPEYLAALLFFSQVPTPGQLYIGRWAQSATHGLLLGGSLTATQQAIANWTSVTAGQFKVSIDGSAVTNVTCGTFAGQTNLNGVASVIQTALQAVATGGFTAATVTWTGSQFLIKSGSTGASSSVSALTAGAASDISAQLLGTGSMLTELVAGIAAESAATAVSILDGVKPQWYGLMFASASIQDSDHLAIAAYIESDGVTNPHIYGVTTSEAAALTTNDSTSIGYQLKALGYSRTFYQYSSQSPYAAAALFGLGVAVNFSGNNTAITFMYKVEAGVTSESLTTTQANALDGNNYNYFVQFNNNTSIVVNGKVASGQYLDTIWGMDWLNNQIQTNVYNLLYTSTSKIPQTDAGMALIANAITSACQQGVANGLLAPGVWFSAGFGQLAQNGYLSQGYYVYAPSVASQSQVARAARQSVPFQVAAKLAGATHEVSISVNVNS